MHKLYKIIPVLLVLFIAFNGSAKEKKYATNNNSIYQVKTSTVKYLSGSNTVSAFLAEPAGKGPFPALIVVHEWWGLRPWIKDNAKYFAGKGCVALAIDLYRGKSTTNPEENE